MEQTEKIVPKLFCVELADARRLNDVIPSLPRVSLERLEKKRFRTSSVLGEIVRLFMMDACGATYDVAEGEYGKPYNPARTDAAYSISHSGDLAVGALLVGAGEVGVDVEYVNRKKGERTKKLADSFFTESEARAIAGSDDAVRAFYVAWTRKEAYLKYRGTGFSRGISDKDAQNYAGAVIKSTVIKDGHGAEYALSVAACDGSMEDFDIEKAEIKKVIL